MSKKTILHKKNKKQGEEKPKSRKFFVTLSPALSVRFDKQLERLGCGPGILTRMAIVRYIEEEEKR